MSQTFLKRGLSLWGSALLAVCALPACTSALSAKDEPALAPSAQSLAHKETEGSTEQVRHPEEASEDVLPSSDSDDGDSDKAINKVQGGVVGRLNGARPSEAAMPATAMPAPPMAAPPPTAYSPTPRPSMPMAAMAKRRLPTGPREHDRYSEPSSEGNTHEAWKPNTFIETAKDPLSTFGADVDTASYTVARRHLMQGTLPPGSAVRVEEFVNYFKFRYTPPEKGAFSVHLDAAPSPFDAKRHFVRVGVQGKSVSRSQRKAAHLVFLMDTSGSMSSSDRLPLAKEAVKIAVKNLNENDTVAIVTYAGSTRDVLPPTPASDVKKIHDALDSLESGGGTAMGSGMEMAYKHAVKKASGQVVSRVVVLTDGDTNIGPSLSPESMLESIRKYVAEGVTLTTVGFGMGNYRDDLMEKLADKGNGNCFYVDSMKEARKVFETQLTGTLEVIAKDVKLQVEFNPAVVSRYRLLGYENRDVADKDFRNDKVDAGEIGAGHNVTALYEVELIPGAKEKLATVRVRAKAPNGTEASEQAFPFDYAKVAPSLDAASPDFRFALAVAATADILRGNPAAQNWSLATTRKLAEGSAAKNAERLEFVQLVTQARALSGASARGE
ncbi:von Willebrand factor type A domain-containing protein [Myxococcus stipitatus DSM 14675]|uniref:von Willebrand factor type A domain-containing protein n=1 Tax=Myxococcus stipitatus (strain DSM 14675 / JCM 12634 / Mx s8) TaxID=1278073 RepID=L7UC97_MYXSD|nr:von Willebrand factor type A domain-containing protein [Myxococcus stipitatus]AGC45693.1 von Willebrand factor type A domain-containing protein [Myxococcus stipitatus DSM 14675]